MPDGFEILEPEETLYFASRSWTHAAREWETAVEWLGEGFLPGHVFGLAYQVSSEELVQTHNACLRSIRGALADGAENLHGAARALRLAADDYVEVDQELTRRVDGLLDLPPDDSPPEDLDQWRGVPGTYH